MEPHRPDIKIILLRLTTEALPFLMAPLILKFSWTADFLRSNLKAYILFLFIHVSWKSLRRIYLHIKAGREVLFAHYFSFAVIALMTAVMLQVMKTLISPFQFRLLLCSMISGALLTYCEYRKSNLPATLTNILNVVLISMLSFLILGAPAVLPALLFCLSVAFLSSAAYIARRYNEGVLYLPGIKPVTPEHRGISEMKERLQALAESGWTILYSLLLLLPPVGLVGMVVFQMLPYHFSLIFAMLPLISRNISQVRDHTLKPEGNRFEADSACIFLLYALLIGIFSHFPQ